jgi:hypothetical protein
MAKKQKRTDVSAVAADAERPDDSAPMRQVHMLFGFTYRRGVSIFPICGP